jgi:hypothetical protein
MGQEIQGFEICAFLRYDIAYGGDSLPAFWEKLSVPSSWSRNSRKDFLIPEDGTGRLSQNVGKELPPYAV